MHHRTRLALAGATLAALAAAAPRTAAAQGYWTNWTSATTGTNGSATGTLDVGGTNVGVSYSGQIFFAQTSPATDYWTPRTPATSPYVSTTYNISNPTNTDLIALDAGLTQVKRVTFSEPVLNPIFAIVSLGRSGTQVTYNFDAPFEILDFGPGAFGGPGTLTRIGESTLTGVEGNGLIRFLGNFQSISWTVPVAETWHGFTVGVQGLATEGPPPISTVPEPSTVALLGAGLVATAAAARRRRRAS